MLLLNSCPFTVCTATTNMLSVQSSSLENRHYGKTKMNQRSSRSHTIFRMVSKTTTYGNVMDSGEMSFFSHDLILLRSWKAEKGVTQHLVKMLMEPLLCLIW